MSGWVPRESGKLPEIRETPRPAEGGGGDDSFLWGVATSGYQSEGGYNEEGQPVNNWAWSERAGDVSPSGRSVDFWNRAPEDFERCQGLGLNAFRLSLEWSRIQPAFELGDPTDRFSPPPFDEAALRHYAEILAACRGAGLEPVVTLHHFVQPAWLGLDAWLHPETISHYLNFVEHTLSYMLEVLPRDFGCEPPRWFITINEPNLFAMNHYLYRIFPSGAVLGLTSTLTCLSHVLQAHARAYRLIHRLYEGQKTKPMVTFNNYCSDIYWFDQAWVEMFHCAARGVPRGEVFQAVQERGRDFDAAFLAEELPMRHGIRYRTGQFLKSLQHRLVKPLSMSGAWDALLDLIYQAGEPLLDYIAFDYYDPFIGHALRWPRWSDQEPRRRSFRDSVLESIMSKWWDWRVLPEGLAFFVKWQSQYRRPMLIAENGMAQRRLFNNQPFRRDDHFARSVYIREHVRMVAQLREKGYPLVGYLHWSLFDNYEWGSYTPRFGLYSIDFTGVPHRYAVDYLGDNPSETYRQEVADARMRWQKRLKVVS
jgi:beta-glucosidase